MTGPDPKKNGGQQLTGLSIHQPHDNVLIAFAASLLFMFGLRACVCSVSAVPAASAIAMWLLLALIVC